MRMFAAVCGAFALALMGVAYADQVTPSESVTSGVIIRAAPTTQSDRLGVLHPGETLELIGDAPSWRQVRLADGRTGFVSKRWTLVIAGPEGRDEPTIAAAEMFAHFVFVGQGAGAILEFPCGVAVIDTGGQFAGPTDGEILFNQYLDRFFAARPHFDNTIDVLFTTHPHADHLNGLPLLIEGGAPRYRVRNVVDNGQSGMTGSLGKQTQFRDAVVAAGGDYFAAEVTPQYSPNGMTNGVIDPIDCSAQGIDPIITLYWGGWERQAVQQLGGEGRERSNPNNQSLVIRIDFGEASLLFTGDLEESAIQDLLLLHQANPSAFDVDLYHVGHHGSHNATTNPLLEAMTPEIAIISAGNRTDRSPSSAWDHGHPRVSALAMMQDAPGIVSGVRAPQTFWAFENQETDPVPAAIGRAIYGTAWEGDLVLGATSAGVFALSPQN
jgi:beta-lactamase superfamily II metal-dependent hydrolase